MVRPAPTQTPSSNGNGKHPPTQTAALLVEQVVERVTFGQLVRRTREAHALTQVQVSSAAEVSPGYIGLIETDKRATEPSLALVKALAHACEATVEETEALWRVAGFLAPGVHLVEGERPTIEEAIEADPFLDKKGKQTLLDVYRALVPRYWGPTDEPG